MFYDVVLAFGQNQTSTVINFPRRVESIVEVQLLEYAIKNANVTGVWQLDMHADRVEDFQLTNVPSNGHVFVVDSTTFAHHEYQAPRVMSTTMKGALNSLSARIQRVSTAGVQAVTFDEAYFFIRLVVKDTQWNPRDGSRDLNKPSLQFDGRNIDKFYPVTK